MKKFAYLLGTVAISLVVSCGPSAEEKAAAEKHVADSIAAADEARIQDSLMMVEAARMDSLATAAADSLRNLAVADSIAAASKKGNSSKPAPKKTPEQKKIEKEIKEVKDANRGRG